MIRCKITEKPTNKRVKGMKSKVMTFLLKFEPFENYRKMAARKTVRNFYMVFPNCK